MTVNAPPYSSPTTARRWPAVAAVAFTVLMWGSSFVVIRSAGTDLDPGPMALLRMAVATVILAPVALRAGVLRRVPRGRLLGLVLLYGVLWFAGYQLALNAAERYIDAGTAALFVNAAPLLIALGAGTLLREGLPARLLVGGAVGLVGVTIMSLGVSGGGLSGPGAAGGVVLALLAAVLYATSVLLQKVILRRLDGLSATWLGFVVGTVVLLPFAPALGAQVHTGRSAPPPRDRAAAVAGRAAGRRRRSRGRARARSGRCPGRSAAAPARRARPPPPARRRRPPVAGPGRRRGP